jgi:hypothetical protein
MKTYNFSVSVEGIGNNKSSIIDSFINEARDEERQLAITHAINKETSKVHEQMLLDFATDLNEELGSIGLEFGELKQDKVSNHYTRSFIKCVVGHISFVIYVQEDNNRNFEDSKYTTFTGDYKMFIGRNSCPYYTACQKDECTTRIRSVEDVLNYMKGSIITHIKKNKELVAQ